jgi:O-antigen/teichoic acid export membrane protein
MRGKRHASPRSGAGRLIKLADPGREALEGDSPPQGELRLGSSSPAPQPEGSQSNLSSATFSGVRWFTVGRILGETSNFVTLVILSRLLTPAQYGLAALALILSSIAIVWSGEGFGNPLVQSKTIDQPQIGTANTLCLVSSFALALGVFLVGPIIVGPIYGSTIRPLVREASLCLIFAGAGAVPTALLQRKLDFRWLAISDSISTVTGSVISIAMALVGFGPSSLVVGIVATQALNTGLLMAKIGWPGLSLSYAAARKNATYGVPATGAALLSIMFNNEDSVIVGARLGGAALGFYYRAFSLGVSYQRRASQITLRLLLPIFSRSADAEHMSSMRARLTKTQCLVMFLPLSLLVITAPSLVPMLLGAKWSPAIRPAQVMAVAGMVGCLTDANTQLLLAAGRASSVLKGTFFATIAYGLAVFLGTKAGVTGAATGASAVYVGWLLLSYHYQVRPLLGVSTLRLLLDAGPGFAAAAALVAVGLPLNHLLVTMGLPHIVVFPVALIAGAAVYITVVRLLFASTARELISVVRSIARRRREGASAPSTARPSPIAS